MARVRVELSDTLFVVGVLLLVAGGYLVMPALALFIAGGALLALSVLTAGGGRR